MSLRSHYAINYALLGLCASCKQVFFCRVLDVLTDSGHRQASSVKSATITAGNGIPLYSPLACDSFLDEGTMKFRPMGPYL